MNLTVNVCSKDSLTGTICFNFQYFEVAFVFLIGWPELDVMGFCLALLLSAIP